MEFFDSSKQKFISRGKEKIPRVSFLNKLYSNQREKNVKKFPLIQSYNITMFPVFLTLSVSEAVGTNESSRSREMCFFPFLFEIVLLH